MGRHLHLAFCLAVFVFLIAPILVIVPLSFNAEPYFTFTDGMLLFEPDAWSLRWYETVAGDEQWLRALANSLVIGASATALATVLGVLAALGLASPGMPGRPLAMGLLISPMVTPVIVSAAGMFFFYSSLGLAQTHLGLILAHAALGTPFVVITVTATLAGFNHDLTRAAANLGDHLRVRLGVCGSSNFVTKIPNTVGHGAILEDDRVRSGFTLIDCRALAPDDDQGTS